ncbi:MAG: polyprenyl synthetase family protein [Puniceicoccales bacterium]|jgi:octaprenyl-diphosphate synthase|nr:polyprenyl synthetase family protein [Puniceicoccales bacterium]
MSEVIDDSSRAAFTPSGDVFFEPLQNSLRLLDDFLYAQVAEFEPSVRELVNYTFDHRGKRLRPSLVFYAGWTGDAPQEPSLIRAAAIVELVHLATLIHDDILDEAALRHNSSTVAAKYGSHTAVLLGDALFAQALVLASEFPSTQVCRLVATATRQVCSGEICQTFDRGNARLSLEQYFRIIQLKTSELFELSCRLGAYLTNAGEAYTDACARYGRHLGIAYQIFDDIADFFGDERGSGKTLGTDFASGKFTLPTLLHLRSLPPSENAAMADALERKTITPAALTAQIRSTNVLSECTQVLKTELNAAMAALAPFGDKPATIRLMKIADYIGARINKLNFF